MWPFAARPIVDADSAAWHVENFVWLIRQFAGRGAFEKTKLVLPKPGFFTSDGEQGDALAQRIFFQVKIYCGMLGWQAELVADDNPLARQASIAIDMVAPKRHALGTYSARNDCIQISYVPALLRQPDRLIATFAHELGHYLLSTASERPICADDEIECLTDLAAVFMGFGVFLANAKFNVETSQGGWRMGTAGYLPEADIVFALALFLRAKRLEAVEASGCLKPHLAKQLQRALRDLPEDHPDVLQIRAALADAGSLDLEAAAAKK